MSRREVAMVKEPDYILHRWDLDPVMCLYRCVPPSSGDVLSGTRCEGCSVEIGEEQLARSTLIGPGERVSLPALNLLAVHNSTTGTSHARDFAAAMNERYVR